MLIILAVVLLLVLPGPWDVIGFAVALALGVGELFLWNKTVKRQRRVVGAQTLIGADALVLAACRPDGQVRVNGEIWAARCEAGADEGETVRVVGRHRLVLTVDRAVP